MAVNTTASLTPYVVPTTGDWDGNDGNWSSFSIAVGSPLQDFRVLVSTRGHETWVPLPDGCTTSDPKSCPSSRGVQPVNGTTKGFQTNASYTWDEIGIYNLGLEDTLGYSGNGHYGYDNISLGSSSDSNAINMGHQVVAGIATKDYYMGLLGLSATSSSFSSVSQPVSSLMQNLKNDAKIPSLSYAYTAGAHYRSSTHGSLVLGGYDQSRFDWPDFSFTFASDNNQPLVVGIQGVTTSDSLLGVASLTTGGHMSVVDSTVPFLFFPSDVCDRFVKYFGLIHDNTTDLYIFNETLREKVVGLNPTLTFKLGNSIYTSDSNSTNILIPFSALDLTISQPYYENATRYMPIRRANSTDQYTIGRAFLQEAYLVVDQERRNFTIAQAKFSSPLPSADIHSITPPGSDITTSDSPPSSGLSTGATIGIGVGAAAAGILALLILLCCWRRRRRRRREEEEDAANAAAAAAAAQGETKYGQQPFDPWRAGMAEVDYNNQISEMGAWYRDQDKERRQELAAGRDVAHELPTATHGTLAFEMDGNAAVSPTTERKKHRRFSWVKSPVAGRHEMG